MAVEIDTATDHVDLFDRLVAFVQNPAGANWDLLRYDTGGLQAMFMAPGLSGTEEIGIGMKLQPNPSIDTFAIAFWMFRAWNPALGDFEQPGYSGVRVLPVWDNTLPYWFVANGQRLIVTAKVSTVYTSGYVGKFLPYGLPSEYPQPYYLGMPTQFSTTRWSTTSESDRNFYDPGPLGLFGGPAGVWRAIGNFQNAGGNEGNLSNYNNIWPFAGFVTDTTAKDRYRELRDNVDGTYPLLPLVLHGATPNLDIYGELDGAYAIPAFSAASEDVIQIGGADYLVVQNIFRTARYYYGTIKLE